MTTNLLSLLVLVAACDVEPPINHGLPDAPGQLKCSELDCTPGVTPDSYCYQGNCACPNPSGDGTHLACLKEEPTAGAD